MRCDKIILALIVGIVGCSGGGSSGPGSVFPPSPPVPNQLALTTQNATDAAAVAMAGVEGSVQLGIAILNSLFDLADTGRLSADIDCIFGLISATLVDNDGGGTITAGDSVELDFMNCKLAALGEPISGRVAIDVAMLTIF